MTEEKYNTKDIRHIDEKNQEYIAESNKMTEEIIIDGVDVAGCPCMYDDNFKNKCTEPYYDVHHGQIYQIKNCTDNPDCYYKQLKRLEQERDELLEEVKQLHNGRSTEELYTLFDKPIKYWEELEQENKELIYKINQLKANSLYNDLTGIELSAKVFELQQENKQLKSALEEIKNNIMSNKSVCTECIKIAKRINEVLQ